MSATKKGTKRSAKPAPTPNHWSPEAVAEREAREAEAQKVLAPMFREIHSNLDQIEDALDVVMTAMAHWDASSRLDGLKFAHDVAEAAYCLRNHLPDEEPRTETAVPS